MRIGVIGANGFIGRNLCQVLLENESNSVYKWTRPLNGNFLMEQDRERFLNLNFDKVFQLAWTNVDISNYRNLNENQAYALASIKFALSCQEKSTRLVLMGTTITDDSSVSDNYVNSKRLLEYRLRELSSPFVSLVKPSVVFSLLDRRPHLFRQLISWVEAGKPVDSFEVRTPYAWIDVIEVRDLANALANFKIKEEIYGTYTVTSGIRVRVIDLVRQLSKHLNGSIIDSAPSSRVTVNSSSTPENVILSGIETHKFFS